MTLMTRAAELLHCTAAVRPATVTAATEQRDLGEPKWSNCTLKLQVPLLPVQCVCTDADAEHSSIKLVLLFNKP
jgi:hypothetical protein